MAADPREEVLHLLLENERKGTYSHLLVSEMLDRHADLPASRRAYMKRLAEGVTERRTELDAVIDRYSSGRRKSRRPQVRILLRMAVYEILYMDGVPDAAACSEAVRLTRKTGAAGLCGYVNGLLRHLIRDKEEGANISGGESLSVRYSTPEWIIRMWEETLGREETEALLKALMEIRPVTIRLSERLTEAERESLRTRLAGAGAETGPGRIWDSCLTLRSTASLRTLPGYAEGWWNVQDESGLFVTEAAGLRGGEQVMDVCAAPGGKALHAADRLCALGLGGHVTARDLSARRAERMRENRDRLRLDNMTVEVRDASLPVPEEERGTADVLFCDVPCSGLGVMGRKRDIKFRVTPEDIEALTSLQRKILDASLPLLKEGGVLIYSTCTIDRQENEDMSAWLRGRGLRPDPLPAAVRDRLGLEEGAWQVQLLPHRHGTDGFYIARLVRDSGADAHHKEEQG